MLYDSETYICCLSSFYEDKINEMWRFASFMINMPLIWYIVERLITDEKIQKYVFEQLPLSSLIRKH